MIISSFAVFPIEFFPGLIARGGGGGGGGTPQNIFFFVGVGGGVRFGSPNRDPI